MMSTIDWMHPDGLNIWLNFLSLLLSSLKAHIQALFLHVCAAAQPSPDMHMRPIMCSLSAFISPPTAILLPSFIIIRTRLPHPYHTPPAYNCRQPLICASSRPITFSMRDLSPCAPPACLRMQLWAWCGCWLRWWRPTCPHCQPRCWRSSPCLPVQLTSMMTSLRVGSLCAAVVIVACSRTSWAAHDAELLVV